MKKLITSLLLLCSIILSNSTYILANYELNTQPSSDDHYDIVDTFPLQINDYETLHFFNEHGRDLNIKNNINVVENSSRLPIERETLLETRILRNHYLGHNSRTPH